MKNTFLRLKSLIQPNLYHGWGKNRRFFEGWYYKVINAGENKAFAFIPGIAMDDSGQTRSFIQVLDGLEKTAEYHKFSADEFKPNSERFELQISSSSFSLNHIDLDLPSVKGRLEFKNISPWPSSWMSPGIMGPYSFVPFMECYHGILSMDHSIDGELMINGKICDFTGGRGYMEKDWGKSFPSAYTWMQTNHFSNPGISIKISIAKIPWIGSSFTGFIGGVLLDGEIIQFTTYNSSKIKKCSIDQEKVDLVLENRNYRLEAIAYRSESTELASPILGLMDGKIEESMCSEIRIKLTDLRNNNVILEDTGRNVALEVAGKIEEITTD